MNEEHPAMIAARASWSAVHRKSKEDWLGLMGDEILIEDPIGVSPIDPEGKGIRGKEAVSAFWDKNIGPNTIRIETERSYAAGSESAHVMTLTTTFPNRVQVVVTGIFTYRVDDAGKLLALRGYWETGDMKVSQPS